MKNWLKYTICTILVIPFMGAGYVLWETSYKGSSRVRLIQGDSTFTSIADIIQKPEFRNKIVYVDVWGTSCPPCFEELQKHSPNLTDRYKLNSEIAFLYLCIDRHPIPLLRWKEKLQILNPEGYHVLVRGGEEERRLASEVIGTSSESGFFPYLPYYFIIDRKGKITGNRSANPDSSEYRPSDQNLLYNKLDSVLLARN